MQWCNNNAELKLSLGRAPIPGISNETMDQEEKQDWGILTGNCFSSGVRVLSRVHATPLPRLKYATSSVPLDSISFSFETGLCLLERKWLLHDLTNTGTCSLSRGPHNFVKSDHINSSKSAGRRVYQLKEDHRLCSSSPPY
jgi:hypothetical protein